MLSASPPPRAVALPADGEIRQLLVRAERRLRDAKRRNAALVLGNRQLRSALCDANRLAMQANRRARHDALTDLPLRDALSERFQQETTAAGPLAGSPALLFIDLDGFKRINDRHGHTAGDTLLKVVAARMLASVRSEDLVCRHGGDEFVILLSQVEDAATAHAIAEKIRAQIAGSYSINGHECRMAASIGLAMYPADGLEIKALLASADASMYRDKAMRASATAALAPPIGPVDDRTGCRE